MKSSPRIVKSSLTYVILLYYQKIYPFIKHFLFQKNSNWMLLNSDIQKKFVQMILHFRKEINVIMCIIEKNF